MQEPFTEIAHGSLLFSGFEYAHHEEVGDEEGQTDHVGACATMTVAFR
jgi:hypothetical protein